MSTPLSDLAWDIDVARNILSGVLDVLRERERVHMEAVLDDVLLQLDWLIDCIAPADSGLLPE